MRKVYLQDTLKKVVGLIVIAIFISLLICGAITLLQMIYPQEIKIYGYQTVFVITFSITIAIISMSSMLTAATGASYR